MSANRLRGVSALNREILRGMLMVFLFAVFVAAIGAAKEVAIAWHYGVGATVDAYPFLFTLAQWPLGLLATVFTVTLVPLVANLRVSDAGGLASFQSQVLGGMLLPGFAIGVLVVFAILVVEKVRLRGLLLATAIVYFVSCVHCLAHLRRW